MVKPIPVEIETDKVVFGRCKWFNSKSGYGFITLSNTEYDIFVHHNSIKVSSDQYKYLVLGEYVQFVILNNTEGPHKYIASEVSGIAGGKLMCETRKEFREIKNSYRRVKSEDVVESEVKPQTKQKVTSDSDGVKLEDGAVSSSQNDWKFVKKRAVSKTDGDVRTSTQTGGRGRGGGRGGRGGRGGGGSGRGPPKAKPPSSSV